MSCWLGAGRVYMGRSGRPVSWKPMGNVTNLSVQANLEVRRIRDARHGVWKTRDLQTTDTTMTVVVNFSELIVENLQELLLAALPTSSASVALVETGFTASFIFLKRAKISNVVVRDSTAVVVSPTLYTVSLPYGSVDLTNAGGTPPYSITYDAAAIQSFSLIETPPTKVAIAYVGTSLEDNRAAMLELHAVRWTSFSELALISDDFADLELTGEACFNSDMDIDPLLGSVGRLQLL